MPVAKTKWRVKKFGDAKNAHYTRKILDDDGQPDLPGQMEKTRKELLNQTPGAEAEQDRHASQ